MKKVFTSLALAVLMSTVISAQQDITPSRYKFSTLPVGAYSLDKQTPGANPPASDPDVIEHWNNGFITVGNPNMKSSLVFTDGGPGAILNTFYQIVDMGGEVGKVLMMKGNQSTFPQGVAGDPGFSLGWWNKSFYTDPVLTPSVVEVTAANPGISEADAIAKATVRLKVVFHIHQNTIDNTNKLFDILAYTHTGNQKKVGGADSPTQQFKSGDFADEEFNEETEVVELTYNPNKWIATEYDFAAPEKAGVPLRFSFRMGGNANSTALLIKEMTMTLNPTGNAVEKDVITLLGGSTSVNSPSTSNSFKYYTSGNTLNLFNLEQGALVNVYSLTGVLVQSSVAQSSDASFLLDKGIYIVKVGNETAKVIIN